VLRPLDIVVLLKMHVLRQPDIGQMRVADLLHISSRSVNEALKRGAASRLYNPDRKSVNPGAMEEALIHGLRYFVPAEHGSVTRGMPTSWAALPLSELLAKSNELPPVWPHSEGKVRGVALAPLHESVPGAAQQDPALYELLALADTLRDGRAREIKIAADELRKRLRQP
jgi:hypothetical protein